MPWPFRRRGRAQEQEAPQAPRNTLTSANYAPIYKAQGGNMFDEFLKSRDEEGITDEIQNLRPDFESQGGRSVNPAIAAIAADGLSLSRTRDATRSWGLNNAVKSWPKEPLEKKPVFETHSYFGRDVGAMHSFIGLRFTGVDDAGDEIYHSDPEVARLGLERKRIVVGFGAEITGKYDGLKALIARNSGDTGGHGRLMDDSGHKVSASTETPIDSARARILISAIPKFKGRFNYNLLSANCNDFAMTMSRLVGARVPAELYDHATGPVMAAGEMKRSAGKQHGGETEVIKRKQESYPAIEADLRPTIALFERDIQEAIVQDGGERSLPGIPAAVDNVVTKMNTSNGISAMWREIYSNTEWDAQVRQSYTFELLEELERMLTDTVETAKKVVTASRKTHHPNVNRIIWKLVVTLEEFLDKVENKLQLARVRKKIDMRNEADARRAVEASDSPQGGDASAAAAAVT